MKKQLIFRDDKSNKFWNIEVSKKSFTVTYGKIGATGTSASKTFDTKEKCVKEAKKVIAEKLKKGYTEIAETNLPNASKTNNASSSKASLINNYLDDWKAIADSKNIQSALVTHFSYLADNAGFDKVLTAIMQKAVNATYTKEKLTIFFPGNEVLNAYPPCKKIGNEYPESYKKMLLKHDLMFLQNAQITLGEHGNFSEDDGWFDALEEEESILLEFGSLKKIISPMWDYSDCWLYHPQEKNAFNEPVIYYLSHEGGDIDDAQPYNIGSLFLKRFAESLGLKIDIPTLAIRANDTIDYEKWYNTLDDNWKNLLSEKYNIKTSADARKVVDIKNVYIPEYSNITTLEPLSVMERLTEINCDADIHDLSPLIHLKKLAYLRLSSKSISDFSTIKQLQKLTTLNLHNTNIKNLEVITDLISLQKLDLDNTKVEDVSALKKLKKLERLTLNNTEVKNLSPLKELNKLSQLEIDNTIPTNFDFLSSLTALESLHAINTGLSSLKPLLNCKELYSLIIYNTPVTFEEILKLRASSTQLEYGISCDYTKWAQTFVVTIENISFNTIGLEDTLAKWINEHLNSLLSSRSSENAKEKEDGKHLIKRLINASVKLSLQSASNLVLEELLVNLLISIINGDVDKEAEEIIFKTFLPKQIKNTILLFNLACYYAKNNNKEKLLEYTQLALEKGHESSRFTTDINFNVFLNDKDFKTLVDNPPMPDPLKDRMAWWQNLPEDLKETLEYEIDEQTEKEIKNLLRDKEFELHYDNAESLTPIANWKNLNGLVLRECMAQTLEVLATLTGLEKFECEKDYYLSGVQYVDISPLSKLTKLKELILTGHQITDISPLQNLIKLEVLKLFGNKITSAEPLSKLVKLQDLSISFDSNFELDTNCLKHLTKLQFLDLDCYKGALKVNSLEGLGNLKSLDHLWIKDLATVSGNPIDLTPLSGLTKLNYLALGETPFESLEPLYKLKSLKTIYIAVKVIDDLKKEIEKNMPWCRLHN